jgi:hypothetical protein
MLLPYGLLTYLFTLPTVIQPHCHTLLCIVLFAVDCHVQTLSLYCVVCCWLSCTDPFSVLCCLLLTVMYRPFLCIVLFAVDCNVQTLSLLLTVMDRLFLCCWLSWTDTFSVLCCLTVMWNPDINCNLTSLPPVYNQKRASHDKWL